MAFNVHAQIKKNLPPTPAPPPLCHLIGSLTLAPPPPIDKSWQRYCHWHS